MKKLILILLLMPIVGFAQESGEVKLLNLEDVQRAVLNSNEAFRDLQFAELSAAVLAQEKYGMYRYRKNKELAAIVAVFASLISAASFSASPVAGYAVLGTGAIGVVALNIHALSMLKKAYDVPIDAHDGNGFTLSY